MAKPSMAESSSKKLKSGDEFLPLLSSIGKYFDAQAEAKQHPDPEKEESWTKTFATDCGKRLNNLPKKKALQLRRKIEDLLFDAEFDELANSDKEN